MFLYKVFYRYYTCYNRRPVNKAVYSGKRCGNKNYRVDKLEEIVLNELRKISLDPSGLQEDEEKLHEVEEKLHVLEGQIKKLGEKKSRLIDLYGDGLFSLDMLQKKVSAIEEQIKKLEAEKEALSESTRAENKAEKLKLVKTIADVIDRGKHEELKLIVETLVDSVTIKGEDIIIKYNL